MICSLFRRFPVHLNRIQCRGMVKSSTTAAVAIKSPARPIRVLFCGEENVFPDGLNYTRNFLEQHSHIQVDAVAQAEIEKKIHEYDMCVVRMMKLDSSLISRASKMKVICQFGVGLEGVDVESATKAGIKVGRIPGDATGNALSCAEHAIYLMLALLRDQQGMKNAVQGRRLGFPTGDTLFGKTVLIVGYGNIGRELAIRLRAFGVKILAIRRSWSKKHSTSSSNENSLVEDGFTTSKTQEFFHHLGQMEDLLLDEKGHEDCLYDFVSRADVIVLSCLLTPQTVGMVNDKFVQSMKKGSLIINVARGGLLDYDSVKEGIISGKIGGLGMDVAWHEPYDPQDPILDHPRVILTPHVAGVTKLSYQKMAKVIADSAVELSLGKEISGLLEFVN